MDNKERSFFKKIHTEGFTWGDSIILIVLLVIALEYLGQTLGYFISKPIFDLHPELYDDGFATLLAMYFMPIGVWILFLLFCLIIKHYRYILKTLTPQEKGNNIKLLLLGFLIGFCMNGLGILAAILHGDVHLVFDSFQIVKLLAMFIAVFCQSSSEELILRAFAYQSLRRGYRSPLVAIIGNSVIFMVLHLLNPGISAIPILQLVVTALTFSLFVYYFDSIWMAMAAHTAWNYTQNIIFGLPNSGIVSSYSIFKLDAELGQITFFYDPFFGVEGSTFLLIISLCVLAASIVIGRKMKMTNAPAAAPMESDGTT